MEANRENILSGEEKEILQEVMNIAFGKATSDLSEIIKVFVVLTVPAVEVLPAKTFAGYLKNEIKDYGNIDIVKQQFEGKFKGSSFLVFSSGAGEKLVSLVKNTSGQSCESESKEDLEKATLVEVGNVLVKDCVGKLAELLGDAVSYSAPEVVIHNDPQNSITRDIFDSNSSAIILKTLFHFEKEDVTGLLFLTTSDESINWLKKALHDFIGQYE